MSNFNVHNSGTLLDRQRALIYIASTTDAADVRLLLFRALFFKIAPEIEHEPELVFLPIAEADDDLHVQ